VAIADQLRVLDRPHLLGHGGHRVAQSLVIAWPAAHQFQLQALVGTPERRTAPVQREVLLQAFAGWIRGSGRA